MHKTRIVAFAFLGWAASCRCAPRAWDHHVGAGPRNPSCFCGPSSAVKKMC